MGNRVLCSRLWHRLLQETHSSDGHNDFINCTLLLRRGEKLLALKFDDDSGNKWNKSGGLQTAPATQFVLFQKSEQVERKQLEEKLHSRVPLLRPLLLSRVPIKWFSNEITRLIIHFKGGTTLFLKNI